MDQMFQIIIKFVKKKKYLYTPKNNRLKKKNKLQSYPTHTHTYTIYFFPTFRRMHIYIYIHTAIDKSTNTPHKDTKYNKFGIEFFFNPNNPKSNTNPNA